MFCSILNAVYKIFQMSQAMYNQCYKNDKMQLQEKIPCIKGFLTSCVDQREITAKLNFKLPRLLYTAHSSIKNYDVTLTVDCEYGTNNPAS
jgi:hypothetical protein